MKMVIGLMGGELTAMIIKEADLQRESNERRFLWQEHI